MIKTYHKKITNDDFGTEKKSSLKGKGWIKMIVKPSVSELLTKANNRYELVIATARRARQIAAGATPLVDTKEESPVTIAAIEIAEGKVLIEC